MPWAIASSLVQDPPCSQKVVSVSGDGGFMFSSQELSTAVLQGCNITHFIWNDEAYNMVRYIIATYSLKIALLTPGRSNFKK